MLAPLLPTAHGSAGGGQQQMASCSAPSGLAAFDQSPMDSFFDPRSCLSPADRFFGGGGSAPQPSRFGGASPTQQQQQHQQQQQQQQQQQPASLPMSQQQQIGVTPPWNAGMSAVLPMGVPGVNGAAPQMFFCPFGPMGAGAVQMAAAPGGMAMPVVMAAGVPGGFPVGLPGGGLQPVAIAANGLPAAMPGAMPAAAVMPMPITAALGTSAPASAVGQEAQQQPPLPQPPQPPKQKPAPPKGLASGGGKAGIGRAATSESLASTDSPKGLTVASLARKEDAEAPVGGCTKQPECPTGIFVDLACLKERKP